MTDRPVRPRVTLGAALALATALLAMAGAVTFPLGLLFVGARPADLRNRIWGATALLLTVAWMVYTRAEDPVTLLTDFAAVAGGALFVLLMRSGPRPALESALLATTAALAVGVVGASGLGIDLGSTRLDLVHEAMPKDAESLSAIAASGLPESALLAIFDATFILALIAGQCVAWRWYQVIAGPAAGPAPAPFGEFRFSDHLIWLFVIGLLGVTAQLTGHLPVQTSWPATVLVISGAIYAIRGLAVLWPTAAPIPVPLLLLVVAAILFLSKFVLPGLVGLGVADTWLDFRRRAAAASGE